MNRFYHCIQLVVERLPHFNKIARGAHQFAKLRFSRCSGDARTMEDLAPAFSVSVAMSELELWKNFNLADRKVQLDKSCVEMREAKTASISGRKRLNDITKAFRAKPKEEQLAMMTEILKCYQEEIDQLSRRSKNCETVFFQLYKALYDLPDPATTIDALINTVMAGSAGQLEIERLRNELQQYDEEFRQLKNQDITIRRLEDALAEFKEQNEDKIAEEVARRIVEVEARADGRVAEALELQRSVERRYTAAVEAMKATEQSADRAQTQLYEVSSQADRKITALLTENAMLAEGN
jgi:homeobox protein cut-like